VLDDRVFLVGDGVWRAASVPIREISAVGEHPYGRSKLMIEEVLRDLAQTDAGWRVALLRYFNPVARTASGLIGEDPNDIPNNLMPYIAQVAVGKLQELPVYGADYATPDGTGVRDYIHVLDLARGHLAALNALRGRSGVVTVNLGTGARLQRAGNGAGICRRERQTRALSYRGAKARGHRPVLCGSGTRSGDARWQAQFGIDAMCADTLRWQRWPLRICDELF